MCGIAGLIGRIDERNRAALQRMNEALVHRGPDAQGTWIASPDERGWGTMLTHRRLSILDLSPAGNQPMIDPVTGHVLAYNGEVYNFSDLRNHLAQEGQTVLSSGDTAVVLRCLALHGSEAIRSLRGMFALACWDPGKRRLLLARDPLGIKPLYLARAPSPDRGWSVAFASELRALLASGLIETPRLDPQAVATQIWNGFVTGPKSAVRGVEMLLPGRLLELDGRGAVLADRDYWRFPSRAPVTPIGEEELASVLEEGLRLHMASDVPLAVFLSGGIDSSAVANLAQRAERNPIHTFTLTFEEQEFNEGPIAKRIAAAIGTEHHEVMLTEEAFVSDLDRALDSLDQPTFDGLNAYAISRAIRSAGFTVALSGTGGDELFGGYPTFRELPMLHRATWAARHVPRGLLTGGSRAALWPVLRPRNGVRPQTRWAKLPEMLGCGDDLLALYQLAYALFLPDYQRELLGESYQAMPPCGLPPDLEARMREETTGRTDLSAISVMEQRLFLGERLLRDNDVASMAVSLEQRVPLVDQVIVEHVDRLPDAIRFDPIGRKQILRRIGLKGLDPQLFERPKSGFVLPFDRWIRRGLKSVVDQTLRDSAAVARVGLDPGSVERLWTAYLGGAPGLYWSRVWALYVLVRWCHRHRVFA